MSKDYQTIEELRGIMPDANEYNINRIANLNEIKDRGINPYPHNYNKENAIIELKNANIEEQINYCIAGRIMQIRNMGKSVFINLKDSTGSIQTYFNTKVNTYSIDLKTLDIGDIIGVTGTLFNTKTNELTVRCQNITILCKSIRALPEKYHGITNTDYRLRYRSQDMIMNDDVYKRFKKRSLAMRSIRNFFDSKGFLEVETPVLDTKYGGGEAKPFATHINALDTEVYLSVSPELYLKRFIVGGFEKVFAISRAFRNEGIDKTHYPEFTLLECYEAYSDYNDTMVLMESLYEHVFLTVNGTTKAVIKGIEVDFKTPWTRKAMHEFVSEELGINVLTLSENELRNLVCKKKLNQVIGLTEAKIKLISKGLLINTLFEQLCEHKIIQPTFVIDHPYETSPLCKRHRNNQELIERFEPFVVGIELGNSYTELNDPIEQRSLLKEQEIELRSGNENAFPMDEEFARAIDIGMPPTGGLGIGIDRLIMFLTGAENIKGVISFPIMK